MLQPIDLNSLCLKQVTFCAPKRGLQSQSRQCRKSASWHGIIKLCVGKQGGWSMQSVREPLSRQPSESCCGHFELDQALWSCLDIVVETGS